MYKNQLQELAQRSCFNLPSYVCIREGPDHAPRFKATVNFNGEVFESPNFCTTLRQAEHAAAEVALNSLSHRGPSQSLAARILDETGVYKNLLQEVAQRVGAPLPLYTTVRSGLGHLPVFTCTVELAGITFTGGPAKNKKQAEKYAAMAAWSSLKQLAKEAATSSSDPENNDEQEQITIARALLNYRLKEKMAMANNHNTISFPLQFPVQFDRKASSSQSLSPNVSKILPMIQINSSQRTRPTSPSMRERSAPSHYSQIENQVVRPQKFPAAGAAPYIPVRPFNISCHRMAPPVTMRTAIPVFSAPTLPPPASQLQQLPPVISHRPIHMASPVRIRPSIPVFAVPPPVPVLTKEQRPSAFASLVSKETSTASAPAPNVVPDTITDVASSLIKKVSLQHKAPDVVAQSKGVLPSVKEFDLPVKAEAQSSVQKVEQAKAASKLLAADPEMNHCHT